MCLRTRTLQKKYESCFLVSCAQTFVHKLVFIALLIVMNLDMYERALISFLGCKKGCKRAIKKPKTPRLSHPISVSLSCTYQEVASMLVLTKIKIVPALVMKIRIHSDINISSKMTILNS